MSRRLVLSGELEQGSHPSLWLYSGSSKQPLGVSKLTMSPLVPTDWLTCAPDSPSYHRSDYVAGRVQFTLYFLHPSNMQLYTACAVHPLQEYIYQHMCYSEHLACHISLSFPGPSSLLWFSANEPGSLRPVRR